MPKTNPTNWLDSSAYPDPIEMLRKAQARHPVRDAVADFYWECRARPWFALLVFGLGMFTGMLAVVVPVFVIAWVQS